jgi:type I restriction-modification system DNA methylase subunit
MIDPSCGTGHILIAAFHHVRAYLPRGRAGGGYVSRRNSVERALRAVHGVDLDPYAALLARYRLLAGAAVTLGGGLSVVPQDWPVSVRATDALLDDEEPLLQPGQYDAVVGNPPYITVRDPRIREQVRARYRQVCSGQYSLALPFAVRMTTLARRGGYVAQLTANSFMKREFGRKFIEEYLPTVDLTWVIDTSGAYIPGHGTPTVVLVHRNRPATGATVTVIRGSQGEPGIPEDPSRGLVWRAIEEEVHGRLALHRLARALQCERI